MCIFASKCIYSHPNVYIDEGFFQGGGGGGVVLNVTFQKGYFCIDLYTNTFYRKCMKFAPKKRGGGGGRPTPPTLPFLRPWVQVHTTPILGVQFSTAQFNRTATQTMLMNRMTVTPALLQHWNEHNAVTPKMPSLSHR